MRAAFCLRPFVCPKEVRWWLGLHTTPAFDGDRKSDSEFSRLGRCSLCCNTECGLALAEAARRHCLHDRVEDTVFSEKEEDIGSRQTDEFRRELFEFYLKFEYTREVSKLVEFRFHTQIPIYSNHANYTLSRLVAVLILISI